MKIVTFNNTELHLIEDEQHEFLLSNKEVASGYGTHARAIRDNKANHADEFIEGKHFIVDRSYKNTPKTMWTKRGIVRLGFFIKSDKAKAFRDWAEDYVVDGEKQPREQLPTITPRQLDMLTPYAIKRDLSTARLRLTLAKKHNEKVIAEFTRLAKQRVDRFKEQEQLLKAHQDKMCVLQDKFYDTEDELERVQHELENKTKELEQVQSELAMRTEETRQLNYRILDHEDTIEKMDKANPSYYRNIFNEDGEEPDKFYEPLLHNGFLDFMYKSSAIKDHIHRLMLTYPHIKEELEDKHNSLTIYLNSMRAFYSKLQGVNKITLEPFGQLEQR